MEGDKYDIPPLIGPSIARSQASQTAKTQTTDARSRIANGGVEGVDGVGRVRRRIRALARWRTRRRRSGGGGAAARKSERRAFRGIAWRVGGGRNGAKRWRRSDAAVSHR
ncbi:hypothetical protein Scep_021661 [Stephania cephalantha]|uniref:Uncharacterized protein n=1 Tax=Stephania cephalantha TaxID=152367 RepID=A0AAP0I0E6_9MAGN